MRILSIRSVIKYKFILSILDRISPLNNLSTQRLKATLTHQVSSVNGGCGMVVGTASTMVTARPEQNQILIQHPDTPSPAQPQVSCALGWEKRCVALILYVISVFQEA